MINLQTLMRILRRAGVPEWSIPTCDEKEDTFRLQQDPVSSRWMVSFKDRMGASPVAEFNVEESAILFMFAHKIYGFQLFGVKDRDLDYRNSFDNDFEHRPEAADFGGRPLDGVFRRSPIPPHPVDWYRDLFIKAANNLDTNSEGFYGPPAPLKRNSFLPGHDPVSVSELGMVGGSGFDLFHVIDDNPVDVRHGVRGGVKRES
jgi:hypothetical protein